ncbi:hypothetical protein ABIB40_004158 [Pedobacter sp. UYP30]
MLFVSSLDFTKRNRFLLFLNRACVEVLPPDSYRDYPGCRVFGNQVSGTISRKYKRSYLLSTIPLFLTRLHHWFTVVYPEPVEGFNSSTLTYSYLCSRFSLSLSTITFQQSHHKVVWWLLLKVATERPTLISF